jgi:hypothetical protein
VRTLPLVLALAMAILAPACGGRGAKSSDQGSSSDAQEPVTIEYVPIAVGWVKRQIGKNVADVKAWAESPAGHSATRSEIREILVKLPKKPRAKDIAAAKKKAEAIVARLASGEDVKTVVRETTEDTAARAKSGALGSDPTLLDEPLRSAAQALGPGETSKAPVRSAIGFHVLARDPIDGKSVREAYQKTRTPELTRKLTEELLSRMRASNAPIDDIAKEAIAAVLGDAAAEDPKRHPAVSLPRDQAGSADVPDDAKEALAAFARKAHPGDVVDSPLGTGPVLVVARAVAAQ